MCSAGRWTAAFLLLAACRSADLPPRVAAAADSAQQAASSDPRIRWLAEHAIRLRSVAPEDRDFTDLAPLRDVLAGVRVVLLGEQSHGDGTTFLAKTRLIEFLHEEMGFDVLAFESGLFDCTRAWERLRGGEDAAAAVPRCVFRIWTTSAQVQPLIAYLGEQARGPRPLELAGFDDQFTGGASREELVPRLRAFLEGRGSAVVRGPDWPPFAAILQSLTENSYQNGKLADPTAVEKERFLRTLVAVRAEVAADGSGGSRGESNGGEAVASQASDGAAADRDADLWAQVLAGLAPAARQQWLYDPADEKVPPEVLNLRDGQMGRNLVWLANRRYPGRKIVVWAATFHAARNLRAIETEMASLRELYRGMVVMGEVAREALGEEMYTLGFTAYEGAMATPFEPAPEALAVPSAGSLEDLLHQAGLEQAIVDFRHPPAGGEWLRQPLVSRPLGYLEMRADWSQIVDGMLYTRTMEPSAKAPEPPP
jgi:erythromycin esterase